MTIGEWLSQTTSKLAKVELATARLDTLVLLEDATGKDRSWLIAHLDFQLHTKTIQKLSKQLAQRSNHVPLAQIRGKTEFYGREFIINEHVLEPRPESETMITLARDLVLSTQYIVPSTTIVDVGTGSGCLAITAKLERPEAEVIATDIDPNCLKVARQNAKRHKVDITLLRGDLLEPLNQYRVHSTQYIVLANLPYVPDGHTVNQAAMNEPKLAIFGGPDGLDIYRRFFSQIAGLSTRFVLTESLPFQHEELSKIAKRSGFSLLQTDDFIQVFMAKTSKSKVQNSEKI